MSAPPPLARRFHLITGKGGVGKSALSAALALSFARQGHRTLLCELDPRSPQSGHFGLSPAPGLLRPLSEQAPLWGVNIELKAALIEYGQLKLRFQRLSELFLDNPLTNALVDLLPGVSSLVMLGKAFHHEREERRGSPRWDRIVVDAPATGHGLALLKLPELIRSTIRRGNLHREAAEMWSLLCDTRRSAIHVVTLPERLPLVEARELWIQLAEELQVSAGLIFLNRLPPSPAELPLPPLDASARASLSERERATLEAAEQTVRAAHQAHYRAQRALAAIPLPCAPISLPALPCFSLGPLLEQLRPALERAAEQGP